MCYFLSYYIFSLSFLLLLVTCISTVYPVLKLCFQWLLPFHDLGLQSILSTSLDFVHFILVFIEHRR